MVNGFIKKITFRDVLQLTSIVMAIIAIIGGTYITATLSPYSEKLSLMKNDVEAYEKRMVKLENNSVSQGERQLVLERLNRLENKVDNIYQLLLEK